MKVDKHKLRSDVEDIIAEGVISGEEIDLTARKIMNRIADLIKAAERADPKTVLK